MTTTNEAFQALMPKVPFCRVGDVVGPCASMVWGNEDSFLYTADQMRAMFDAATERAAKMVEDTDTVEVRGPNSMYCQLGDAAATRAACAAAIRAGGEKT